MNIQPCAYPNCSYHNGGGILIPVIAIPTMRSKGESTDWTETTDPTYLIGPPLCRAHTETYKLSDWFPPNEWAAMQEGARSRGLKIADQAVIKVEFKPLGWTLGCKYMELERRQDNG